MTDASPTTCVLDVSTVTPRSVDRCIAVAAHGRRCQQTTYRGSPYCWHHTQSRKVWAPSRTAKIRAPRPASHGADALTAIGSSDVVFTDEAIETAAALTEAMTPEQLRALCRFLRGEDTAVFRIEKLDGEVVGARTDARLRRALAARHASSR